MLPDSQDLPALGAEEAVDAAVAGLVPGQLRQPERGPGLGQVACLGQPLVRLLKKLGRERGGESRPYLFMVGVTCSMASRPAGMSAKKTQTYRFRVR